MSTFKSAAKFELYCTTNSTRSLSRKLYLPVVFSHILSEISYVVYSRYLHHICSFVQIIVLHLQIRIRPEYVYKPCFFKIYLNIIESTIKERKILLWLIHFIVRCPFANIIHLIGLLCVPCASGATITIAGAFYPRHSHFFSESKELSLQIKRAPLSSSHLRPTMIERLKRVYTWPKACLPQGARYTLFRNTPVAASIALTG